MTAQNSPRDDRHLQRRIADLERRLAKLETSPRAGNTSVTHGKFTIRDGDVDLLRVGYLGVSGAGNDVRGVSMRRPSGEYMFATWNGAGDDSTDFWSFYDKAGNQIASDDAVSGQGLARPYIGGPAFAPADRSLWPTVTSSSYTPQWYAEYYKQHPKLLVTVWTQTDAGTSGDVRVSANGASTSQAVPGGDNSARPLTFAVPGDHMTYMQITVELRRTAGTGFMGCWVMGAYGVQS